MEVRQLIEDLEECDESLKSLRKMEKELKRRINKIANTSFRYIKSEITETVKKYKISGETYPLFVLVEVSYVSSIDKYLISGKGIEKISVEPIKRIRVSFKDFREIYHMPLEGDVDVYINNKKMNAFDFYKNLISRVKEASRGGFDAFETEVMFTTALRRNPKVMELAPNWLEDLVKVDIYEEANKLVGKEISRLPVLLYAHD